MSWRRNACGRLPGRLDLPGSPLLRRPASLLLGGSQANHQSAQADVQ